jgi:acetyltransferase
MGNIRKLLNPNTIALIGATERENSLARTLMENLLLSEGRHIFPVNPGFSSTPFCGFMIVTPDNV